MLLAIACLIAVQDGTRAEEERTYTVVVRARFPIHDLDATKPPEDDPDCRRVEERLPKVCDKRIRFHGAAVATGSGDAKFPRRAEVTLIAQESLKLDPAKIRAAFDGYPVDRIDVSIAGRLSRDSRGALWLTCRVSAQAVRLENAPAAKGEPKPADVLADVEKMIRDGETDVLLDGEAVPADGKLVFRLRKAPAPRK